MISQISHLFSYFCFSPVAQKDAEKRDTVVKESGTTKVTVETPGHLPSGKPKDSFTIESLCGEAVEQACGRPSECR